MKRSTVLVLSLFFAMFIAMTVHAARVDLTWNGTNLSMKISPEGMGIAQFISSAAPVPSGKDYANVSKIGLAYWDLPSPIWQYYEDGAATVTQYGTSSIIPLDGDGVFNVANTTGKINAFIVIDGSRYYINTYAVNFYLNGAAMTRHGDGQNFVFNLSGVAPTPTPSPTPSPSPTATPSPTPTAVPMTNAQATVVTGTNNKITMSLGTVEFQNLFFNTTASSEIKRVGIQYYYSIGGSPWSDQEWSASGFTAFPVSINLSKIRIGGTRINIIIEASCGEIRFANVYYWDLYLNGIRVFPTEGAWQISPDAEIRSWDFTGANANGWTAATQISGMDPAIAIAGLDGLSISANGSSRCFAYWGSPIMELAAGRYGIKFTITSDTAADLCPQFRLRINRTDNWSSWDRVVYSIGGEAPLLYNEREYVVWVDISENCPVVLSFDILSFDPNDSTRGSIFLKKIEIR